MSGRPWESLGRKFEEEAGHDPMFADYDGWESWMRGKMKSPPHVAEEWRKVGSSVRVEIYGVMCAMADGRTEEAK